MDIITLSIVTVFTFYNYFAHLKFKKYVLKSNQELYEIVKILNNRK